MKSFLADHTTFKNIIGSGVILESKSYLNQVFQESLIEKSTTVAIQSCLFLNCAALDNGGGMQVSLPHSTVQISNTGYTNCKTSANGGAFYVVSKQFSIDECCISICSADEYDAFYYSNQNFNHEDEIKQTYIYSILPSSSSTSAIYFDSAQPSIQNNNITAIQRSSIRSIIEFEEFDSITFQYNSFVSCAGKSIIYFHLFKGEIRNCNFDNNQAGNQIIHINEKEESIKFCFCCFMKDNSRAYNDQYSLFLDCVFDHPFDQDKFPNKDLTLRCTFNSKYTTNDIEIPNMSKNGCWALISNIITEMTPVVTAEPDSHSALNSTLYVVMFVALIAVVCILAFFVYRWWSNKRSKDYMLTMYAQV